MLRKACSYLSRSPAPFLTLRASPRHTFSDLKSNIKRLRTSTGAPLLKCRQALSTFDNNYEEAKNFLYEKNLATAERKADKETNVAVLVYETDHKTFLALGEVGCETDFVMKNAEFLDLVGNMGTAMRSVGSAVRWDAKGADQWMGQEHPQLKEDNQQLIARIQENIRFNWIDVKRFDSEGGEDFWDRTGFLYLILYRGSWVEFEVKIHWSYYEFDF